MLEFVEVSLDQIALAVDGSVDGALGLAVALVEQIRSRGAEAHIPTQRERIIPAISHDMGGRLQALDKGRRGGLVGGLTGRQGQADRQARLINHGMDLGAQSPTRETDGVIRAPFFPPAACWWARMIELSMKAIDSGDRSAKALKTLSQTPAFAHLLKRLYTVV